MKLKLICFLLLTSFIGVSSEKRLVYRDSFVTLFENVMADNPEKDVSLYINGAKQPSLIVIFRFGNGAITSEWRMNNYTKIFIDANRNIRIANIDKSYEGKYYIQSSGRREVELTISDNLADEVEKIAKSLSGNVTDQIEKITKRLDEDRCGSWALIFAILVILIVSLGASLPVHIPVVWNMLETGWFWCRKYVKTSKRNGIHQPESNYDQVSTMEPADSPLKKSKGTDPLLARVDDTDSETMKISGRTDPDLPRRADPQLPKLPPPNLNITGGTDPCLPKLADPQLSKLLPSGMNISEGTDRHLPREPDAQLLVGINPHLPTGMAVKMNSSDNEDDFLPTAQGIKKIDIRKT